LPSSWGPKQIAKEIEKKMARIIHPELVLNRTVWKCDPELFIDAFFTQYKYYDVKGTREKPIDIKLTADGLINISKIESMVLVGLGHISLQLGGADGSTFINSKTEYVPMLADFVDEKEAIQYLDPYCDLLLKIEQDGHFKGKEVFIRGCYPADMKQQWIHSGCGGAPLPMTWIHSPCSTTCRKSSTCAYRSICQSVAGCERPGFLKEKRRSVCRFRRSNRARKPNSRQR
jgi:hypothetical protein